MEEPAWLTSYVGPRGSCDPPSCQTKTLTCKGGGVKSTVFPRFSWGVHREKYGKMMKTWWFLWDMRILTENNDDLMGPDLTRKWWILWGFHHDKWWFDMVWPKKMKAHHLGLQGCFMGYQRVAINLDLMGNIYRYLIYWDKQAKIYGI